MTDILNALVILAIFIFVPAMAYGSQLALGALGITMVYSILRFSNFAHGELMSFGAMTTILWTWALQSSGFSLGIFPTASGYHPSGVHSLVTVILAVAIDKSVYQYYRKIRATEPVTLLIVSIGVMFLISGLIRFIIGPKDQVFTDGQRFFIMKACASKNGSGLTKGLPLK